MPHRMSLYRMWKLHQPHVGRSRLANTGYCFTPAARTSNSSSDPFVATGRHRSPSRPPAACLSSTPWLLRPKGVPQPDEQKVVVRILDAADVALERTQVAIERA